MRNRIAIFSLLVFGLLISVYAMAGSLPKWVTNIPADKEHLYFVGINTDAQSLEDGKRSAVKQAIAELTEQFETRSNTRFMERKTELETKVLDEIGSHSENVRIKGTFLNDWHFEKARDGRYDVYVLIQYPKAELEMEKTRLQNEAAERFAFIRKALKQGEAARAGGDVKAAYTAFMSALKGAIEGEDIGLRTEASSRLRGLLEGMQIKAVSGDGQKGELYKGLKEPLVAKVFIRDGGMELPVPDAPIYFISSGKRDDHEETVMTDAKGLASYKAATLKSSEGRTIKAFLDVDRLFPLPEGILASDRELVNSYINLIKSRSAGFTFEVAAIKKGVKVIVLIREENLGTQVEESIVGNELAAGLTEAGYDVIGDHEIGKNNMERLESALDKNQMFFLKREFYALADVVVTGTVKTRKGGDNKGWTFSSHADGYVKAVNLGTGKVIARKNLTGVVGFGDSEEKASINVLKKAASEIRDGLMEKMAE